MVSSPCSSNFTRPPRTSSKGPKGGHVGAAGLLAAEQLAHFCRRTADQVSQNVHHRLVTDTMGAVTSGSNCCCVGSLRSLVRPRKCSPVVCQHLRRMVQVIGGIELSISAGGRTNTGAASAFSAQQRSHTAALVVLDELTGKLLLEPLALFAAGEKAGSFHFHQPRSHFTKSAGGCLVGVCLLHRAGVLIGSAPEWG